MAKSEIVEPREIVKASNDLFRARCKIKDVLAGRIFMAFASLVDEKDVKENDRFVEYKITASSVLNGIDAGGDNYKQLRDAAYSLIDQKLEKRRSKNSFKVYTLFSSIDYENGIIKGEFHKDLVPFFIAARGIFTRLSLQQYMKLPSLYSQKLFGFLKSWDDKPEITISVSELHEMLDTPESIQSNFKDFRIRVLEKAHKDITEKTTLRYEWEPIKKGRAVESVRFIFARRLALPMVAKKADDAREKQSQDNTRLGREALFCFKAQGNQCSKEKPRTKLCKFCLEYRESFIAR